MPSPETSRRYAVFSDVDGTLVHYPKQLQPDGVGGEGEGITADDGMLYLPPSRTGTRGVISHRTLRLCSLLRNGGASDGKQGSKANVPFILISGMRTTTLFQRLPFLPRADAYVSESGGRIFYPRPILGEGADATDGLVDGAVIQPQLYPGISGADSAPFALVEDVHWRGQMSKPTAAGADGHDNEISIEQRQGKLWDFARTLMNRGYTLDTLGYATAFRVNRKHQRAELAEQFDAFIEKCARREDIPKELGCSTNLGCVDVYPTMSGKRNCADYLAKRFLGKADGNGDMVSLKSHAFCLCDDDNDIEMALACRAAYLPGITSESIGELASNSQAAGTFIVTEDTSKGIVETRATEAALEKVLNEVR
ncbi:hypothetical protein ACHAXT_003321 [Thalassiosira profunda]